MTLVLTVHPNNGGNNSAADDFILLAEGAAKKENDEWFKRMVEDAPAGADAAPGDAAADPAAPAPAAGGKDPAQDVSVMERMTEDPNAGAAPADDPEDVDAQSRRDGSYGDQAKQAISDIVNGTVAAGKDIGGGVVEAAPQAFSGVMAALGEVGDLLEGMAPAGGFQIVDPETGEFDLKYLNSDEFKNSGQAGLFEGLQAEEASTVTGGFIRSTSQFLTGFIPAAKGLKAVGLMGTAGKGLIAGEMAAGAIADAVVFDPFEDRLATYLNEVPALAGIVPDYLADTDPANQGEWEGRLKNAIEGAGLGALAEGLIRSFKYYKAQREAGGGKKEAIGAKEMAVRDQMRESAEADIVQEITDDAVAPLGDPDAEEMFVLGGDDDPTLQAAMERLGATKKRTELYGTPAPAPGFVRMYHGGALKDDGTLLDNNFTSHIDQAKSYQDGGALYYVDVPKDADVLEPMAINDFKTGLATRLDPEQFGGAKLLDEGYVGGVLNKIKEISDRFQNDLPNDASPMDEALNMLRKGKDGTEKLMRSLPRKPAMDAIKAMGGIDPDSPLARELYSRDIKPKTAPGLFKKGGLKALDNAVRSEHPIFGFAGQVDELNGYIDQQEWIDALEAEKGGNPLRTQEEQIALADADLTGGMADVLGELGIDLDQLTNEEIIARLKRAEDEAALQARTEEIPSADAVDPAQRLKELPDEIDAAYAAGDVELTRALDDEFRQLSDQAAQGDLGARSLDDLTAEDRARAYVAEQEAKQAPLDPAPKGKIFINHARIKADGDVKHMIQTLADANADAINARRGGETMTHAQMIEASKKEFTKLSDLLGRDPIPMTEAQMIAAREILTASGEQIRSLAAKAAGDAATSADLYNFRRSMIVHYAIQAEVFGARTQQARALNSWRIHVGSTKKARNIVCEI